MDMQFLSRLWKKTPIRKKIRVAYYSYRNIDKEEIVLSYKGENYRLICFCTGGDGNLKSKHKKRSKFSPYRLWKRDIIVESFTSRPNYTLDGFEYIEIDRDIIQELHRLFFQYFKNCGIEDKELIGDVSYEDSQT